MTFDLNNRYCVIVAKVVFYTADTTTVRLLLAWASAWYAVLLVWPLMLHDLPTFARPAYGLMAVVGNEWFWAALFMGHAIGVHWRILDRKERVAWGLVVNIWGFAIWAYCTASLNIVLGMVTPGTALEWTLVFASAWALYRTGLQREVVSA